MNMITPYNKHKGGRHFSGFSMEQSSRVERMLATVGHRVKSSFVTSSIQLSSHMPQ